MGIPSDWDIPDAIRRRLGATLGRQRTIADSGHVVLIVHKMPTSKDIQRHATAYWRSPQGVWRGMAGPDGLAQLRREVDAYVKRADQLEQDYDKACDADAWFAIMEEVVPLHRAAKNLFATLLKATEEAGEDSDLITLRDRAGDVDRIVELLHADVRYALEYSVAKQAEEQARLANELNRVGHRLSVLAALFLPLSALGAVFSMNLQGTRFWLAVGAGLTAGAIVFVYVTLPTRRVARHRRRSPRLNKQMKRY